MATKDAELGSTAWVRSQVPAGTLSRKVSPFLYVAHHVRITSAQYYGPAPSTHDTWGLKQVQPLSAGPLSLTSRSMQKTLQHRSNAAVPTTVLGLVLLDSTHPEDHLQKAALQVDGSSSLSAGVLWPESMLRDWPPRDSLQLMVENDWWKNTPSSLSPEPRVPVGVAGSQCTVQGCTCLTSSPPHHASWDPSFRLGCWGTHPNYTPKLRRHETLS